MSMIHDSTDRDSNRQILAFVHMQKTGGTTLKHILRRSFGPSHCDILLAGDKVRTRWLTPEILKRTRWVYPRLRSISGHAVAPFGELAESGRLRFYTLLRDPIARTASNYVDQVCRGNEMTLSAYLNLPQNRNRLTRKLCGEENAARAIEILERRIGFVGLLERFDESLVMLRAFAGNSRLDIRYQLRNESRDSQLKKQLLADPAHREQIAAANQLDLQVYRYVVEVLYPRQVRAYGPQLAQDVIAFQSANRYYRSRPDWLGGFVRLFLYKPLVPILTRAGRLPGVSAGQSWAETFLRNRRWALGTAAVVMLLSALWLFLSMRTLGLMMFAVAGLVFALFPRHHRASWLAAAWAAFFVATLLPMDITFTNVPGPPRLVPVVATLSTPDVLEQAKRGDVYVRQYPVPGMEPKWVWVW
jgi:hypothetical protein